jgi:hypothetical protein
VENKRKVFAWWILQNRLWMADRVVKYGGQTNSVCKLCNTRDESALHMIVTCSYAKQVWHGLEQWSGIAWEPPPGNNYRRFKLWWNKMTQLKKPGAADRTQKLICITWNSWKERCRRDFDNKAMSDHQLREIICSGVDQWRLAWCNQGPDQGSSTAGIGSTSGHRV